MISEQDILDLYPMAKVIALKFRINGWETEDLAQEAFMHLLNRARDANAGIVAEPEDLKRWASSVLKRRIIDIRKHTVRGDGAWWETTNTVSKDAWTFADNITTFYEDSETGKPIQPAAKGHLVRFADRPVDTTQEDERTTAEEVAWVRATAAKWPEDQRRLLEFVLAGENMLVVAKVFDVPLSTIYMRVTRLKKKLRKAVKKL